MSIRKPSQMSNGNRKDVANNDEVKVISQKRPNIPLSFYEQKIACLNSPSQEALKLQIRKISNNVLFSLGENRPVIFIADTTYDARSVISAEVKGNTLKVYNIKLGSEEISIDTYKIDPKFTSEIKDFFQELLQHSYISPNLKWMEKWSSYE